MAFKLADINIGSALVENWGRATAYFQRYLQTMNAALTDAINQIINQQAEIQQAIDLAEDAIEDVNDLNVVLTDFLLGMGLGQYGLATVSPDAGGNVALPHTYLSVDYPPTLGACTVTPTGTAFFQPQMTAVDGSNLYAILLSTAGVPITTGFYTLAYRVAGA